MKTSGFESDEEHPLTVMEDVRRMTKRYGL